MHQRTTTVTLARILTTPSIPSTHHFWIDDHINAIRSMPPLASPVIGNNSLYEKSSRAQNRFKSHRLSITGTSTACKVFGRNLEPAWSAPHPAAHPNFPKKSSFLSGKQIGAGIMKIPWLASGHLIWELCMLLTNMGHVMNRSFQLQHSHIEPISLRCKLEIWMYWYWAHPKCVRWKWFHCWIDHIVAKCDMHLSWCRSGNLKEVEKSQTIWNMCYKTPLIIRERVRLGDGFGYRDVFALTQCPAVTTWRRVIREPPHLESIDLDNVITREPFACCGLFWIH